MSARAAIPDPWYFKNYIIKKGFVYLSPFVEHVNMLLVEILGSMLGGGWDYHQY